MILLLWLLGCADDPCASQRDLTTSPGGLDLTEEEHPAGWGQAGCFQCHPRWEIHQNDCMADVALDPVALDASIEGVDDCASCHGWNGVPAWATGEDPR